MKRHYIIFVFAIFAVVALQVNFIVSQHQNYFAKQVSTINSVLAVSIDKELYIRNQNSLENITELQSIIFLNKTSSSAIAKISKNLRFSPELQKFANDASHRKNGMIVLNDRFVNHSSQDDVFDDGIPLNIVALDSIFKAQLELDYHTAFTLYAKNDSVLSSIGDTKRDYNYTSSPKQIGMAGHQFLITQIDIPLSNFLEQSIWILTLSMLFISISLITLLYQLTTIRRKTNQIKQSELAINGTIHDLKSPLNSAVTMLSWFEMTEIDVQKKHLLSSSLAGLKNLALNIESLLTNARNDKTKITVHKEKITSVDILNTIEQLQTELTFNYPSKAKTFYITNNIPHTKTLYVDKMHLENIMRNIIDNALKYSNNDVEIGITIDSPCSNSLKISTQDNGWGIDPRYRRKLFKQFYRVPRKGKNDVRGFGLGLAFAKHIAKSHGGDILLESSENHTNIGSKFAVIFNIEEQL